jgi:O-antigen/teichoic acid export membrane protein
VAFYGTLAGALAMLDLGLSTAISRQVAILNSQKNKEKEMNDLVYSVEIIYWIIAVCIGLLIVVLSNLIAVYWVNSKDLPVHTIQKTVMLMGGVFAFQFPASIYNGAMVGLEKQIPNAVINVIFTLLKAAGVIVFLKLISPTVEAYFWWQALITFLFTLVLRFVVWKKLKFKEIKAAFSKEQLKKIWRFAAGLTGISLITFFLTQIDKIVVSKMVLLEFVGYYSLAFMVASVLTQIISPIQPVVFPKFSSLVAENRQEDLVALYHKSCRWVSIIIFPIGFILILFADEILLLWTRNPVLTENTAPILRVCAAGTICNSLMWIPYAFQLAKGNTRFTIYQNIIASIILVPLLFWWTSKYGAIGASFVWLAVNAGYILISIPLFHKYFLKGQLGNWYKNDVALPFFAAAILIVAAKYIQMQIFGKMNIIYFGLLIFFALLIYGAIIPEIRVLGHKLKFRKPA